MILILGGTAEARELARRLENDGIDVVSSLAGRVQRPRLPVGEVRVGGFGGPDALARWLDEHDVDAVIDATHPFAQRISASAVRATRAAGVPLLRLERPGWTPGPGDVWHPADDLPDAAHLVAEHPARRVWLTSGRQGLEAFAKQDAWFLIRCVDPPQVALPRRHELLLARGPYTLADELALIDAHRIELLVTKDSGGALTEAKLDAARTRGLPVVVIRRPPRPAAHTVSGVDDAVAWAQSAGYVRGV